MTDNTRGQIIASAYLRKTDGSLEDRYKYISQIATQFLLNISEEDRHTISSLLYMAMQKRWLCLSTPILANSFREDKYGLPISCYVVSPDDNIRSITQSLSEMASLTQYGGGVGVDLTRIRQLGTNFGPRTEQWKSSGVRPWARMFDVASQEVTQGTNRRGAIAVWVSIDGENFWQLLNCINETTAGSDPANFIKCNMGVVIPEGFMERAKTPDSLEFNRLKALLSMRMSLGHPYIQFQDNMQASMPESMVKHGRVYGPSNICTEIHSDADDDYTMICCLCSLNVRYFPEWNNWSCDTRAFGTINLPGLATIFLESVLNSFVYSVKRHNLQGFDKALAHVEKNRAIGIGQLGLASLFMSGGLAYESQEALDLSTNISRIIHEQSGEMSKVLGEKYGVPEFSHDYRHNRRTAIAPTITNSAIAGETPNKEPIFKNVFQDGRGKQSGIYKNPWLVQYLESRGLDVSNVLEQVMRDDGSVLNLPTSIMDDNTKEIFKTSFEMDPLKIVAMDIARQSYLTQGQSNNYNLQLDTSLSVLFKMTYAAWRGGLTTLYYIRSNSAVKRTAIQMKETRATVDPLTTQDCGCDG